MSTGPSLYELLTGHFANGRPLDDCDEKSAVLFSVMDSIQRILNTRAGSLKHLPDYGLPDLSMIYQHLPASANELKKEISRVLLAYEPRLKSIEVEIRPPDEGMVLKYMLTCHLKQKGLVSFGTYFVPDGKVGISPWHTEEKS